MFILVAVATNVSTKGILIVKPVTGAYKVVSITAILAANVIN